MIPAPDPDHIENRGPKMRPRFCVEHQLEVLEDELVALADLAEAVYKSAMVNPLDPSRPVVNLDAINKLGDAVKALAPEMRRVKQERENALLINRPVLSAARPEGGRDFTKLEIPE